MKILTVPALLCVWMLLHRADCEPEVDYAEGQYLEAQPLVTNNQLLWWTNGCPAGWTQYSTRCFQYFAKYLTWADAEQFCLAMGSHLASVHDLQEYQEIQRLASQAGFPGQAAWIGGSDAQQVGVWLWTDGSGFLYSNWCAGEPSNTGVQRCMQINYSENMCWDDVECYYQMPFVCARNL